MFTDDFWVDNKSIKIEFEVTDPKLFNEKGLMTLMGPSGETLVPGARVTKVAWASSFEEKVGKEVLNTIEKLKRENEGRGF